MKTIKVQPWGEDQGEYVLINEEDFEAGFHEAFGEAKPAGATPADASIDDQGGDEAAKAELAAARADYEAKLGKKPFMGWDAATLRAKIAGA